MTLGVRWGGQKSGWVLSSRVLKLLGQENPYREIEWGSAEAAEDERVADIIFNGDQEQKKSLLKGGA